MALTQAQLQARKHGLGGSDAAVVLGLSRWKSPYELYLEKTQAGLEETDSEFLRWGQLLEPVVAAEFSARTKKKLRPALDTVYHPKHRVLLANPDYYVEGENAGLEIKTTAQWHADDWGDEGTDQVPQYYLVQALHYAACCDWDTVYLAVLIGGNKLKTFTVDTTPAETRELMTEMIERELAWWKKHITGKKAPPRPNEMLNKAWSETTGKTLEVDDGVAQHVRRLKAVKGEIRVLEAEESNLLSVVKEVVADFEAMSFAGKKLLSWKFNKPSLRPDLDLLLREHPDIHKKIMREVPGPRVLRLT